MLDRSQPEAKLLRLCGRRVCYCAAAIAAIGCLAAWAIFKSPLIPTSDRGEFWLAKGFAAELDRSRGLVAIGHERAIKAAIAVLHKGSCFVIGSSRIMTVRSSIISAIDPRCTDTYNLGVSGGTLEDDIAFAGLSGGARAIFFGIDHWSFKFGADDRFTELLPAYRKARCKFRIGPCATLRLLDGVRDTIADAMPVSEPREFRKATGRSSVEAVTLPDASHVYSEKYLREMRNTWNEAHLSYKLATPYVQQEAIEDFRAVVKTLMRSGTKVYLLLVPYHPRAAKCENANLCQALQESENAAKMLARTTGASICGSYFSESSSDDFMSDMFIDPERLIPQGSCK